MIPFKEMEAIRENLVDLRWDDTLLCGIIFLLKKISIPPAQQYIVDQLLEFRSNYTRRLTILLYQIEDLNAHNKKIKALNETIKYLRSCLSNNNDNKDTRTSRLLCSKKRINNTVEVSGDIKRNYQKQLRMLKKKFKT